MLSHPVESPNVTISDTDPEQMRQLLRKRGLTPSVFFPSLYTPEIGSSLKEHVAFAYKNIYPIHSSIIPHVTRALMHVPVLVNMRRRYKDSEALALTDKDIKLIQLAVLFHHSMRLNNKDKTSYYLESGILLYHYLTKTLGVEKEKAEKLAEAVAYKDRTDPPKNIYQKLIYDADYLENPHSKPTFDINGLDFYQDIASKNEQAMAELSQLRLETHSFIEAQGDGYKRTQEYIKEKFECKNAYDVIFSTIVKTKEDKITPQDKVDPRDYYQIYPKFINVLTDEKLLQQPLLDDKSSMGLDRQDPEQQELLYCLNNGYLLARSIEDPTFKKEEKDSETEVVTELRMLTKTPKQDKYPLVSTSLLVKDGGCATRGPVGFLVYHKKHQEGIQAVSSLAHKPYHYGDHFSKKEAIPSVDQLQKEMDQLIQMYKKGGPNKASDDYETPYFHNEIEYDLHDFNAIYYSLDPNLSNSHHNNLGSPSPYPHHHYAPALQAIYLQQAYYDKYKRLLPIFEYSGIHNYFVKRIFSSKNIIAMWKEMTKNDLKNRLSYNILRLTQEPIPKIKQLSLFGDEYYYESAIQSESADHYYPEELRAQIDTAIEEGRQEVLNEIRLEYLQKIKKSSNFITEVCLPRALLAYPTLLDDEANKIILKKELEKIKLDKIISHMFDNGRLDNYNSKTLEDDLAFLKGLLHTPEYIDKTNILDNSLLKIYYLAIRFDLPQLKNQIQEMSIAFISKKLKEFTTWNTCYHIEDVMVYISLLGIRKEMEPKVHEAIQTLLLNDQKKEPSDLLKSMYAHVSKVAELKKTLKNNKEEMKQIEELELDMPYLIKIARQKEEDASFELSRLYSLSNALIELKVMNEPCLNAIIKHLSDNNFSDLTDLTAVAYILNIAVRLNTFKEKALVLDEAWIKKLLIESHPSEYLEHWICGRSDFTFFNAFFNFGLHHNRELLYIFLEKANSFSHRRVFHSLQANPFYQIQKERYFKEIRAALTEHNPEPWQLDMVDDLLEHSKKDSIQKPLSDEPIKEQSSLSEKIMPIAESKISDNPSGLFYQNVSNPVHSPPVTISIGSQAL